MKDLVTILDAIETYAARGVRMALATIVGVRGSAYRHAGARLLVTEQQELVGNISGGCLESDVMIAAEEVIHTGVPRMVTYDLTADDDAVWGLGLGCNGVIDIFIERVDPSAQAYKLLRRAIAEDQTIAVVTIVGGTGSLGARMVVSSEGDRHGTLGAPALDDRAARAAVAAEREGTSRVHRLAGPEGEGQIFIEVVRPPVRLIVCGAGHDAIPVVHFASALGWRVIVADSRSRFLTGERFPGAQRFIEAAPAETAAEAPIDPRTYIVIMTHNFQHDRDLLRGFLATNAGYIGMLGPKVRTQKILDELRREGNVPAGTDLNHIYGPLGLDIGSDGAEEIAVSVISEILAVDSGRPGGFLRSRVGSIHEPASAIRRSP